jgi:NAD(P)H-quinone oxidoreductase subunit 5
MIEAVCAVSLSVLGAVLVPCLFLIGGLWRRAPASRWAAGAFVAALVSTAALASETAPNPSGWLRIDTITVVMLLLVCGLGVVIVRYAATAVRGEPRAERLIRWLMLTLAAVSTLVISGHLLVIATAWTVTSLTLHQLLTHEAERPMALLAAHKKFIASRVADAALFSALLLMHTGLGSLELSHIDAWARATPTPEPMLQVAALLIVIAVAIRSAQLPFHGWLTQVMEAPTPVSALLHAGVVNIGGFVLIRLASFMAPMTTAQLLLVAIGLTSVVGASLVTMTRVSVKVALAWSTCAQMGFMLVQCGLGAWPLALLHLVAHSVYKAHAFLSAGSTVERWRIAAMHVPRRPPVRIVVMSVFALVAVGMASVAGLHAAGAISAGPATWGLTFLVAVSITPLVAFGASSSLDAARIRGLARAAVVVVLVLLTHRIADTVVSTPAVAPVVEVIGWLMVGAASVILFALKTTLTLAPGSPLARRLWPPLFAGLHLDERFTRLTFQLWPPQLPTPSPQPSTLPRSAPAGVSP